MVNQSGQVSWSAQTTSYRRIRMEAGTRNACPFRFQGQYEDTETGLYYNRFRYYSSEEGEYLSQDPLGPRGSFQLYSYVMNPTAWVDPLGLIRISGPGGRVDVHAFPGPLVGGIEHAPLHVHIMEGNKTKTRVLTEDYHKKGQRVGSAGDVYPGDPAMSKQERKFIQENLDDLAKKARSVFDTGKICP